MILLLGHAWAHTFAPATLELDQVGETRWAVTWRADPDGRGGERLTPRLPDCSVGSVAGVAVAECPEGPGEVRIEGLDGAHRNAVVRVRGRDGLFVHGVLEADSPSLTVPREGRRRWTEVLWDYVVLGVEHIWAGPDHLLFVTGLTLLVTQAKALAWTITGFTVAHSITLALATFGLVALPSAPVEAVIALSIVLLAAELCRPDETLTKRYPMVVSFVFGLVHGLGFAGVLAELGLPAGQAPLALLSFNVGVEIGQLLFVGALLPVLYAAGRATTSDRWKLGPAYAMGTLAMAWTFERIAGFW